MTDTPRNDAAMAEILASMRRIVSENERRARSFTPGPDDLDILVLTRGMRVDLSPDEVGEEEPETQLPAPLREPVRPVETVCADRASAPETEPDETRALLEGAPDGTLDEAAVADIVRAVMREEFRGEFGKSLTQQIRTLVHAELTRAMASRD